LKFSFKEVDHGLAALKKLAKETARAKPYVKVGLLGGSKDHRPGESLTNVEIGLVHEFGAPSRNIPERSFIRAPFRAKRADYLKLLKRMLSHTLSGAARKGQTGMGIARALGLMGQQIASDFKRNAPGTPPPNAESTLARKLAKTRPGSLGEPKTLVDTGRMINSITYAVVLGAEKTEGGEHA
jgi:hypothetical protein